jgi:hypothetical protein
MQDDVVLVVDDQLAHVVGRDRVRGGSKCVPYGHDREHRTTGNVVGRLGVGIQRRLRDFVPMRGPCPANRAEIEGRQGVFHACCRLPEIEPWTSGCRLP